MIDGTIEVFRLRSTGSVIDADGSDLGRVGEFFVNDDGEPEWVTVTTDRFGTRECFIPLQQARIDGDHIHVPYSSETIAQAPHVDTGAVLTPEQEAELARHYGLSALGPDDDDSGSSSHTDR